MDAQQEISLKLKQQLDRRRIKFAYPTRVNYLHFSNTEKYQQDLENSFQMSDRIY